MAKLFRDCLENTGSAKLFIVHMSGALIMYQVHVMCSDIKINK